MKSRRNVKSNFAHIALRVGGEGRVVITHLKRQVSGPVCYKEVKFYGLVRLTDSDKSECLKMFALENHHYYLLI